MNAELIPPPVLPEPEPLPEITPPPEYPTEALGNVLGEAAKAIAETVQAPPVIAAQSVLATAAFLAQDKANIYHEGRTTPLSLFALTVAASSERKSSCDRVAMGPVEEWQREQHAHYRDAERDYKDSLEVYKAARAEAQRAATSGRQRSHDARAHAAALADLVEPKEPIHPQVICTEPTLEGLFKNFRYGRPSQALMTDEGGQFFGGHAMDEDKAMRTVSALSLYWDGRPIIRTRGAEGETHALYGRRLSAHLMVQPIIAENVLGKRLLQEQGLLARFLLAEAGTIAGTRLKDVSAPSQNPNSHPAVVRLHARMRELLSLEPNKDDDGALELPALKLGPEAHRTWAEGYNAIELMQAPGQPLEVVRPSAGKAAENALRIAGVLAVFEGQDCLTADHVTRGWTLASFYLETVLRQAQNTAATAAERDALEILHWMKEQGGAASIGNMQKRIVPARHRRSVGHLRAALERLERAHKVEVTERNTKGEPSAWRVVT